MAARSRRSAWRRAPDLPASVIPFILRGISLVGIDSVMAPYEARIAAWDRVGDLFSAAAYESLVTEAGLGDVPDHAAAILKRYQPGG